MVEWRLANSCWLIGRTRFAGALGAASVANLRLNGGRGLPSHVQALAILIPHQRGYSTQHSESTPSSSQQSYPPPGFDAKQAKEPLSQDKKDATSQSTQAESGSTAVQSKEGDKAKLKELETAKSGDEKAVEKKEKKKNLTVWQKVKKEALHYWDGTKLLSTEVRISTRLAGKMAAGYELSRREQRQVCVHTRVVQEG